MTIFTKSDNTEEKKAVENEKEGNPKVVVNEAEEERHISNCGWVPMEGGNFDRPKEKRSSSFGPLSIIRLSPSPLARTPSPSPPDYDNGHNNRMQRCTRITVILIALFTLGIVVSFFIFQRGLINVAYQKGVYHGWNAATFSNKGISERLEQDVEINPAESYEKIQVPRFGSNRPAIFLHDFKKNLTAIVDVLGKRCFVKDLDRATVTSPKNLINMLKSMEPSVPNSNAKVVRETYRVGSQLTSDELNNLSSSMLARHCSFRPTYLLKKATEENGRFKRRFEETLEFASMNGGRVEVDEVKIEPTWFGGEKVEVDKIII